METTSYDERSAWRDHLALFPERLRVGDGDIEEAWWRWQDRQIHLDRFEVEGPRAHLILLHGGGGNGRLLAPLGSMALREGVSAVAPDLPGYGLSRVEPEDVHHERWVELVVDLVAAERRRHDAPIVLFGLSLGGMLAYHAAARLALAGAPVAGVIATTLADPRLPEVRAELARWPALGRWGKPWLDTGAALFGGVTLPIRWLAPMQRIANDAAIAKSIAADPLSGGTKVPLRFLASIMALVPPLEPEAFTDTPLLWLQPAADRWTSEACSRPFFDRLGCPKIFESLEGCGHLPMESPGVEQLVEACRGFLTARAADFAGPPPKRS